MRPFLRYGPLIVAAPALVLAAVAIWWFTGTAKIDDLDRCYRIGFENSQPYQFVRPDGGPDGPAVELISEAARRAEVCLEWVYAEEGPDEAFASGKVDLWPLVGNVGNRTKRFHITRPWRSTRFWLVSRANRSLPADHDLPGLSIAMGRGTVVSKLVDLKYPSARKVKAGRLDTAMAMVCEERVDALILQDFAADLPHRKPAACEHVRLAFAPVLRAALGSGIGASYGTPGAVAAADAIRDGISELVRDGSLASIYFRWFGNTSRETFVIDQVNDAEDLAQRLGVALGILALLVIAVVWQSYRVRLAQAAAERASNAARKASRAKSRFLSTMSHEIRTPLSGVLGMATLLEGTNLSGEQQEQVQAIRNSGAALLGIIDDVLDFSRIEAGKLELDDADFDLPALVASVTQILDYQAASKNLALASQIDERLPAYFRGDQARLRQVILNLVGNAVKFTEEGGVTLNCVPVAADDDHMLVRFEVTDSGPGIPAEVLPALFRPFQQADAATTRRYGGTGLGLAISRRLVKMMGGTIGCHNNADRGATFWFTIPLVFGGRPADSPPAERGRVGATSRDSHRALVVEDNETNRKVAVKMLERLGLTVETADNGVAAVELATRNRYRLIFMDCRMPVMDGYEAARKVRARENGRHHSVIVALTANAFAEDRQKCFEAGMDDYLAKPVSLEGLEAIIQKWAPDTYPGGVSLAHPRTGSATPTAKPK